MDHQIFGIDWGCAGGDWTQLYKGGAWFYLALSSERGYMLLGLN